MARLTKFIDLSACMLTYFGQYEHPRISDCLEIMILVKRLPIKWSWLSRGEFAWPLSSRRIRLLLPSRHSFPGAGECKGALHKDSPEALPARRHLHKQNFVSLAFVEFAVEPFLVRASEQKSRNFASCYPRRMSWRPVLVGIKRFEGLHRGERCGRRVKHELGSLDVQKKG